MSYLWAIPLVLLALASGVQSLSSRSNGRLSAILFFLFSVLSIGTILLATALSPPVFVPPLRQN